VFPILSPLPRSFKPPEIYAGVRGKIVLPSVSIFLFLRRFFSFFGLVLVLDGWFHPSLLFVILGPWFYFFFPIRRGVAVPVVSLSFVLFSFLFLFSEIHHSLRSVYGAFLPP